MNAQPYCGFAGLRIGWIYRPLLFIQKTKPIHPVSGINLIWFRGKALIFFVALMIFRLRLNAQFYCGFAGLRIGWIYRPLLFIQKTKPIHPVSGINLIWARGKALIFFVALPIFRLRLNAQFYCGFAGLRIGWIYRPLLFIQKTKPIHPVSGINLIWFRGKALIFFVALMIFRLRLNAQSYCGFAGLRIGWIYRPLLFIQKTKPIHPVSGINLIWFRGKALIFFVALLIFQL